MALLSKRKSRAVRRAEARAVIKRAKLEARLAARNEARRVKNAQRADVKALRSQIRAQRSSDRSAVRAAELRLKAVQEGKLLSPTKIKRLLTVARLVAPIVVPVAYRASMAARGAVDERRAARLGVPLSQLGRFSGHGAQLSARVAGAEQSLRRLRDSRGASDGDTRDFVSEVTARLTDLAAAVTAAENMPPARRRGAHAAISTQLDGIDADIMARLGVV